MRKLYILIKMKKGVILKDKNMGQLHDDIFGILHKEIGKKINSKAKGDRNENDVCKYFLNKWAGTIFKRVPRSGGLGASMPSLSGDVLDLSGKFVFCIETKHYKKVATKGKLRSNSKILKFWKQTTRDADRVGKLPLFLFRINEMKKGAYIAYFDKYVSSILLFHFLLEPFANYGTDIYGFKSEDLLNKVDYNELVEILKS